VSETVTPVLGLNDPLVGTQFAISDFRANWETLDGSPGVFVCTSETLPDWGSDQAGRLALTTDQGLTLWDGSIWVPVVIEQLTIAGGAYTLPTEDGTSGQVLSTDGGGDGFWRTVGIASISGTGVDTPGGTLTTTNGVVLDDGSGNLGVGSGQTITVGSATDGGNGGFQTCGGDSIGGFIGYSGTGTSFDPYTEASVIASATQTSWSTTTNNAQPTVIQTTAACNTNLEEPTDPGSFQFQIHYGNNGETLDTPLSIEVGLVEVNDNLQVVGSTALSAATGVTVSPGDNSTNLATTAYVNEAVPVDIGMIDTVIVHAYGSSTTDVATLRLAPPPTEMPAPQGTTHAPDIGSAFAGFVSMAPSDTFTLSLASSLIDGLWDTVDLNAGLMTVWDQAGLNALWLSWTAMGITSGSSINPVGLTQLNSLGSDLSLVDDTTVTSAGGGYYNVLISNVVEWD